MIITDKQIYNTTYWTIRGEDGTYYVKCEESMFNDKWEVYTDSYNINIYSDLGIKLIEMCKLEDAE